MSITLCCLLFMYKKERIIFHKPRIEKTGMTRKDFSIHIGIPLRTIEDWEAGRRRPPEYIPRLIEYQLKYEELIKKKYK